MPVIQKKFGIVLIAVAGLLLAAVSPPRMARADGPSLAQTLDWMESTYDPHEGGSLGYGSLINHSAGSGDPFFVDNETFSFKNCYITIVLKEVLFRNGQNQGNSTYIDLFNLRDIDPDSLKIYLSDSQYPAFINRAGPFYGGMSCGADFAGWACDTEELDFTARNQKPLISEEDEETYIKRSSSDFHYKTSRAYFVFRDLNYAARFSKAFSHAAGLCVGEASPF